VTGAGENLMKMALAQLSLRRKHRRSKAKEMKMAGNA
jgi:hypothetical protein